MLFILILLAAIVASLFIYKRARRSAILVITIALFILLVLEGAVYGYFIYQCYLGKGIFLIGNQRVLDSLYKLRLIYAMYYCQHKKTFYYRVDDELGYSIGRGKNNGLYVSNMASVRSRKEYPLAPEDGVLRMACFGDSFVHCDDEKNEDTWEYQLEKSVGNLEALNFGVGGHGLVQSYLRYLKDGMRFSPHIVFCNYVIVGQRDNIGDFLAAGGDIDLRQAWLYRVRSKIENGILVHRVTSLNDLFDAGWRKENIYDRLSFYRNNRLLSSKILSLSNVGLLLKASYLKYRIKTLSESDKSKLRDSAGAAGPDYNLKLLENYMNAAKRDSSTLLFVTRGGIPPEIVKFFQENSGYIKYSDVDDYFNREANILNPDAKTIRNSSNHYNALGNKIYAAAILDILKENEWQSQDKVFYYDKAANSFLYRRKDNPQSQ